MDQNPYTAPDESNDRPKTRWFFLTFYALAIVWGVRHVQYWLPSLLDLLIPVALAICLGSWAISDARRRGRPIPFNARSWFFLLAVIVVPGYFIVSRGWRGIAWVAINSVAWFLLTAMTSIIGGLIAFGSEWPPH